ncbi:MAG: hypothetical protein E7012_06935 [Alphaproteobacteria bacterium]|nr:hypothetical protein [Alphaproteobacteria bacterium]
MSRYFAIGSFAFLVLMSFTVHASEDMEFIDFGQETDEMVFADLALDTTEEVWFDTEFEELDEEIAQVPSAISATGEDENLFSPQPVQTSNPLEKNDEKAIFQQENDPKPVKVDISTTLTDNLKNDTITEQTNPLSNVDKTWIGKLISEPLGEKQDGSNELSKLLEGAREEANNKKRSNASVFDISGVMLRMSLEQADRALRNRGFKKILHKYQIPNFIKWRNEELCRNSGVVGYEKIESCITQKAKKENHQYVQTAQYAKYNTKEEIEVTFTSNFTANRVIKVVYKSQAANRAGNSPKSVYLRNIKVYDFWKTVNQKYGQPDDKENVTWGMGGNKPYLKAATGYLKLEDPMLKELDYTRMSREDQRYMNTDLYSF